MLTALVVVVVGGTLALLAAGDRWLFADRPAGAATSSGSAPGDASGTGPSAGAAPRSPALAPLPAGADTPDELLGSASTAVSEALVGDPGVLGPAGQDLLVDLREVEASEGPARRLAAVTTSDSVRAAVDDGRLDADAGRQVLEVLAAVARPERLIDLVQTAEQGPPAIGPAGPELHTALVALDHEVPAGETATRAAELLGAVNGAAAEGRVSEAFRAAAVPMLERLADPTAQQDLQALLADVERDPAQVGPARWQVLESLRDAADQPVYPQGNTALDLLTLLRQEGQVTADFREEAVPVVEALVR
ncbi:MAG TPA: hypothetical protein VER97_13940 [Geodermatophilus sp.]|nr:hypothetical protein [Geodermatophilus sp.]